MKKKLNYNNDEVVAFGVVLVILSAFFFSFQGILVKFAYQEAITLSALLFWRKVFFLPLIWAFALKKFPRDKIFVAKKDILISASAGAVGYMVVPYLSFTALKEIEAGIERILIYTFPLFVIIINSILERKLPEKKHIIIFFIMQIGVVLLMGAIEGAALIAKNLKGSSLVMGSAIGMAVYIIMMQNTVKRIGTFSFILWAITGAGICMFLYYLFFIPFEEMRETNRQYLIIFILALASFLPAMVFSEGVKRIGGARASLISGIGPFMTILFAYIILDEVLTLSQIFGGAIIVFSIAILERQALSRFLMRKYFRNNAKKN